MRAILGILLFLAASAADAAGPRSIVDAAGVARAMANGAVVWDVRRADDYDQGHVPGAVNIDHVARALLDEKTQLFLPVAELERRLGDAGIDTRKTVIVYGVRGSSYAHFALFALDYLGYKDARVFHEGFDGWRESGRPVSKRAFGKAPVKLKFTPRAKLMASVEEVVAAIDGKGVQFVDVRRPVEFTGQEAETAQGGHIPGAVLIPYNDNYVDPDAPRKLMFKETAVSTGMSLKRDADLRALYKDLDPAKETIVYCHTGIRSSVTMTVLARLGFRNVRNYHGSWFEYGNRAGAAVER